MAKIIELLASADLFPLQYRVSQGARVYSQTFIIRFGGGGWGFQ